MTWDATMAAAAGTFASACNFAHDSNRGSNIGENIFASSRFTVTSLALSEAVNSWYNEVSAYSFASPGFSSSTGHFTQVVWKGSVKLGCGYATCGASFAIANGVFVVCRYSAAGNMQGAFATNVLAPIGAVPAYVSCASGGGSGGSASPGSSPAAGAPAPAGTPSPGTFPVAVRVRSVVRGYTLDTFRRDLYTAGLAKTLGVSQDRVSVRDVQSARRRVGDGGVAATSDVSYPAGTDANQVTTMNQICVCGGGGG